MQPGTDAHCVVLSALHAVGKPVQAPVVAFAMQPGHFVASQT
jgi:hypothetical protein